MTKLLRFLKPYTWLIVLNVLLVAVAGIGTLMLPDRMSNIISEGITTEIVYETTDDGSPIYINMGVFSDDLVQLPKFVYENAGKLVVLNVDGVNYVFPTFKPGSEIPYEYEQDEDGNPIYITSFDAEGNVSTIAMPKFKRTVDGQDTSELQQGKVVLDDSGSPQVEKVQVSNLSVIWKNGLLMVLITIIISVASISISYISSKIGMNFGKDLRSKIFHKILYFSQEEEEKFGAASLITRSTNDVTQMQMIVVMSLRMVLNVPIMFAGGLIMAFSKDPEMTKVLLVTIPVIALVVSFVAAKVVPIFKQMQKKIDYLTLVSRENITGVRVIRAFGQDERENKRFKYANSQVTGLAVKSARIMSVLFPLMQLIMSLTSVAIIVIAIYSINSALQLGSVDFTALGNMMAVVQYIIQIMISVVMFSIIFIMVPRASVSANRINEVLGTENKIHDPANPKESAASGSVEFKDVCFAFPGAQNNILTDISFNAKGGETTAVVGSTGSGKSTLINLIPRLYDVTSGGIYVDGMDIREYSQESLRAKIGFVSQKAVLFEGTVRDNISYGKQDATDEEVAEAAKIAQIDDFIDSQEEKYGYKIEQGGANLSGGQKQRIAIARAVCRRPSIYIFDDSFSALDFKTDKKLRKALKKITEKSTVFIVAQRIGTVMNADRIIVLQDGRIAGIGKHAELMRNCEVYREIAESQLSPEEISRSLKTDAAGGAL